MDENENLDLTTIADLLRRQVQQNPEKIAFKFEGRNVTYQDLDHGANQIANGFLEMGLKPDDRICYLAKNSIEYYELLFAASKAGVVMCPINWRLALPEIEYILKDSGTKCLFVGTEFKDALGLADADLPSLNFVCLLEPVAEPAVKQVSIIHEWKKQFSPTAPDIHRAATDDAVQLYTSGTTGRPKGAVLSNLSLLSAYKRYDHHPRPHWNEWTNQDISLVAMPCFHVGGTAWGLTGVANGATGVIMREFDATKVLDFIDEHKISKIFLVPAAIQFIVNQPQVREVDFSQLKFILYGASPIPLDLLKQAMEVFQCGFVQMYGMTETSGTIVALPPEDHDPEGNVRMRSAGKALEDVEIAILGEDGTPLNPGEVGEIATRSTMNMKYYWNLPDATKEALTSDGWLRTGDAGYVDKDGYVFIQDRVKDMIISGGENIYPAEVENAIYGHPGIADVGVIGVPHEKWGEAVMACVVLKENTDLSEEDVIAWTREHIAKFKCPKTVSFLSSLPRNPSGKILRKELRAPYWADKKRSVN